jgi:hypothetical protein
MHYVWATAANLVVRYGSQQQNCLCAMVHCAERSHEIKICDNFHALGHSAVYGHALWATEQDLVIYHGRDLRKIWFRAMGDRAGFGSVLWAIEQDLVPCYGP